MGLETRKMDNLDDHLRFRPRAIWGRHPRPNGGHRRPRPISGVYSTRYPHLNPASEPIGRYRKFQELLQFPDPIATGQLDWDEGNHRLKNLFERVAETRLVIHRQASRKVTPEMLSGLWAVCNEYLREARDVSSKLIDQGQIPYPEPAWFSSRDTGIYRSFDLMPWIHTVAALVGSTKQSLVAGGNEQDLTLADGVTLADEKGRPSNTEEILAQSSDEEGESKAQWALGA
ncbi:hypothetical protein BS78_02G019900 [Paspalum vaginatum]|nr:hypothetical protein BS78_02G019900 [Paspalum vaginatum]